MQVDNGSSSVHAGDMMNRNIMINNLEISCMVLIAFSTRYSLVHPIKSFFKGVPGAAKVQTHEIGPVKIASVGESNSVIFKKLGWIVNS